MKIHKFYPYLFIAPSIVLVIIVSFYPTLYSLYLSLTSVKNLSINFIGLSNYRELINSYTFWYSLRITLVFVFFSIVITTTLAFVLALVFNKGLRFTGVYMTMIFMPWVLSEIISSVIWRWMFLRDYGILQNLLGPIFDDITLILTPSGAMGIVVAATVWRSTAFVMLLILAGLQTIPRELVEAAKIDGASGWQAFWNVTWPLVKPTTSISVVLLSIQAVNAMGMFLAITDGAPGRSTEVLGLHMYRQAIQFFHLGYGATIAVAMLILNGILAAIYLSLLRGQNPLSA